MRRKRIALPATLVLLCCLQTSAQKLPKNIADAAVFVNKFYKWYVPRAKKSHDRPAAKALSRKRSAFDPQLAADLQADFDAQNKAGATAGIDWDPFLSGEGQCDSYPQSTPVVRANSVLVPVYCQRGGTMSATPVVTAVVAFRTGQWAFKNFLYKDGDLVTSLERLKKNREKQIGAR